MGSPSIISPDTALLADQGTNPSENTCPIAFDAASEVARARALLVQVHAVWPITIEHIRDLIALDQEVRTTYAATRRERDAEIRRIDREVAR